MKYRIEAIDNWPRKDSEPRRSPSVFRMKWDATLKLLTHEVELLGGDEIVLRLVCDAKDLRKDGMLRAHAFVGHVGVILSVQTDDGPLEFATDKYDGAYGRPGWQANVHAIALSLAALRDVDRWGVTHKSEQYAGFKALPAGSGLAFANGEAALQWMRDEMARLGHGRVPGGYSARECYRELARIRHPDVEGGGGEGWERLGNARTLLVTAGLL